MGQEIINKAFRKAMEAAGLGEVILCKGYGYFWFTSDNEELFSVLDSNEPLVYVCHFNQLSISEWVAEAKRFLKSQQ